MLGDAKVWHHCDRVNDRVLRCSALVFFETSVLFTVRHELSLETRVDEILYNPYMVLSLHT